MISARYQNLNLFIFVLSDLVLTKLLNIKLKTVRFFSKIDCLNDIMIYFWTITRTTKDSPFLVNSLRNPWFFLNLQLDHNIFCFIFQDLARQNTNNLQNLDEFKFKKPKLIFMYRRKSIIQLSIKNWICLN